MSQNIKWGKGNREGSWVSSHITNALFYEISEA